MSRVSSSVASLKEGKPIMGMIAKSGQSVALRGIHIHSRVCGLVQRTTIDQSFVNEESDAIEATYTFPVPERAAVCGFEVQVGDRVLRGEVDEREKAVETYDKAIRGGHGGFLLEQHRPDAFTINVGNLLPRQRVSVRIEYVEPLEVLDGTIRLVIPTVVAPRYATDTGTDPLATHMDAAHLNPPHLLHVDYGVFVEVDIALGRQVRSVSSPSHDFAVQANGGTYRAVLRKGLAAADRDIVLEIRLNHDEEPSAQAAIGPDGDAYVMVSFVPEFDDEPDADTSQEIVFILDCSGSMEGTSIEQSKRALLRCLQMLRPGDRFNICRFGSTHAWFAPSPVDNNPSKLKAAIDYVHATHADMGGTEILPPLQDLLKQPPQQGSVRQVILLTDGQVTNEPAILQLANRLRDQHRFFTFGIGPAASRHLVRELATRTGGAAEFIGPHEEIEPPVLRTFSRLSSPLVSGVSIDWGVANAEQANDVLPPLFDRDTTRLFARCPGGQVPPVVTLRGMMNDKPITWSVPVTRLPDGDGPTLACCWARQKIDHLCTRDTTNPQVAGIIVSLSKKYGIASPLTSFVAVERRVGDQRSDGCPQTRRIPLQVPPGWHGIDRRIDPLAGQVMFCLGNDLKGMVFDRVVRPSVRMPDRPLPPIPPSPAESELAWLLDEPPKSGTDSKPGIERNQASPRDKDEKQQAPRRDKDENQQASLCVELATLLARQRDDGSFRPPVPAEVSAVSAASHARDWIEAHAASLPADADARQLQAPAVLDTVAAIWLMRTTYASLASTWRTAERRALGFLGRTLSLDASRIELWLQDLASGSSSGSGTVPPG